MSPRNKRLRKVINPPRIKGYKPYGPEIGQGSYEPVVLLIEEYEALRLCDYEMKNHHQASMEMGVSRPTFTRIYAQMRQKISKAFVEARPIAIEGGKVYFDSEWYQCHSCNCFFNHPQKEIKPRQCPLCGGNAICNYDFLEHHSQEDCQQQAQQKTCGKGRRKRKNQPGQL